MIKSRMLAAALAASALSYAHAAAPDRLYAMLTPSVWKVQTFDQNSKPIARGSAVVVGPEVLLTNCHVLKGARYLTVGQDNMLLGAQLQYADPARDMCQIVARNLKAPPVRLGDSERVVGGQRIYTLGAPLGLELTLSEGLVSALRRDERQRLAWIQISAPISPGSSGGGLFDDEGRLIGITTAGMDRGQNLNLAIPIRWVQDLAERSRDFFAGDAAAIRKAGLPPPVEVPARSVPGPAFAQGRAAPGAGFVRAVPPVASGYAAVYDIDKLAALEPAARRSYEEFLKKPFPRAFALGVGQGSYVAWTDRPKVPGDDPDPAVRVLTRCEAELRRKCVLYAVDDVVVYRNDARP